MSANAQEAEQFREHRRRADESRALAAEHRARAHELRAGGSPGEDGEDVDSEAFLHAGIEEVLAEIAELRAAGFDERARSCEALIGAEIADGEERDELLGQASAAVIRAAEIEAEAIALREELAADPVLHDALSEAAMARARAREQRSLALAARAEIGDGGVDDGELRAIRAECPDAWAELYQRLALAHQLRGQGLDELAEGAQREAERLRALALELDERLALAEGGDEDQAADAAA